MNTNEHLTEELLEEYAERGKKISYELAWYVARVRFYDDMLIWLRPDPEATAVCVATFGLSERFIQLTYARHDGETATGLPRGRAALLEQVAELRLREPRERKDIEKDLERYAREWKLRQIEEFDAVDVLLDAGLYTVARIAELVGVTISFVEEVRTIREAIRNKYAITISASRPISMSLMIQLLSAKST